MIQPVVVTPVGGSPVGGGFEWAVEVLPSAIAQPGGSPH